MKYSGWDFLEHMLRACELIERFMVDVKDVDEFINDELRCRAVTMELFGFAELVKKTAEDGTLPGKMNPWREIIRFRDKVGHWYFETNFKVVYDVVTKHLPTVHTYLKEQKRGQP
ncbi:MAG: DUF86 domain-containing protein [Defluviitaleaceae bacterium]|nr:DUF86 domain-containing protein [Defluviitaleaceae bacterium]